jgi:hypothetical protein
MIASVIEALGWASCLLFGLLALDSTLSAGGHVRIGSLTREAIVTGVAVGFGLLAGRRVVRLYGGLRPSPGDGDEWTLAGVAARCLLGVPTGVLVMIDASARFSSFS